MNYIRIYNEIINNAKLRGLNKKLLNYYTEKHHIIPKCLNGTNDKDNLVLLTGREHYLCHYLLWKIYKTKSLLFAYHKMVYQKRAYQERNFKISSKQYEILRSHFTYYVKNRVFSNETKLKMSNSKKGIKPWNYNTKGLMPTAWNKGKKLKASWNKGLKLEIFVGENNPRAKSCSIENRVYKCLNDACANEGICKKTLRKRLLSKNWNSWFYLEDGEE